MTTQTCFDNDPRVQEIYQADNGSNGACWILKIDDHYRVLKRLFNRSGTKISEMFKNELKFQIPLSPIYYDNSQNHPGERFDWILMDYIPGNTLTKLINGGYAGNRVKRLYMLEIFAAIAYQLTLMREKGIKHRDLKPDNIVVDGDMIPHIIDWDDSTTRFSLSINERHGTIPFAAPEIFSAQRKCESDIFSFGAIMFNMITECYPFASAYMTKAGLQSLASQFP